MINNHHLAGIKKFISQFDDTGVGRKNGGADGSPKINTIMITFEFPVKQAFIAKKTGNFALYR